MTLRSVSRRIILAVSACFILSAAAAASPPDLAPLRLLPGDATPGPAAGSQVSPSIARGGDQFLAAWQDDRGNSQDICATRLDASGSPIDATSTAITQAAGTQGSPRVAWNGSNWLVAWQSQVPTQYYYAAGVLAVRVSPAGQILDPTPITVISYQNSSSLSFALASDGTNWAVVAEGTSAGEAAIRGVRIAPDGTVLDPGGVVVVPEASFLRFGIELGGVPGEYLMVWNQWRSGTSDDILAYRLTPALQRIETTPLIIAARATYETNAKVAANGTDFFVAWNLNDNYLSSEVYGSRVTFAGQVLEPNGRAFTSGGVAYGRNPAVTWDGANWIATWPNYGTPGLNAGRMSPQGTVLDPGGVAMPGLGWGAIAGKAAGGFLAAWSDNSLGSSDVYGAAVTGSLAPGARTVASLGAPRQSHLSLASNGNGYLSVFLSARSAGSRVVGQRLDASANAIDVEPFEIAGPAAAYTSPAVAWNGSLYLVTWVLQSRIYARRVAADGTMIDPAPVQIMNGQESGVAALGDVFLVVGNYAPSNPEYVFVFGTRVRGSDGVKLDASPIVVGSSFSIHPRVASFTTRWLVAWEQHPTHDDPHASVIGNLVDASGVAGTAFAISAGGAYNLSPAIAAGPDTALVAWSDARNGFNNQDIYARRVLANGAILDGTGLALSTAANSQTLAAVGWSGAEFVALFQDPRNIPYFFDEHLDVYGTRIGPGGVIEDPAGFALANDPVASEIQPAAAGGGGSAVLGCSIYRSEAPNSAFRVGLRLLGVPETAAVPGAVAASGARPALAATPNPSSGPVEFSMQSAESAAVVLSVFDVTGREVARLYHGRVAAGNTRVAWDGTDVRGARVPRGIYFARLSYAGGAVGAKVILR